MVNIMADRINDKKELKIACDKLLNGLKQDENVRSLRSRAESEFVNFAEMFLYTIQEYKIPENIGDNWSYSIEITEDHCSLFLEHYTDDGGIDESFTMVRNEPGKITVEEYSQLHEYAEERVTDWLNRGKFCKADLHKDEWRIPAYCEPCKNFEDRIFHYHEWLGDLPEKLQYLNKYSTVATLKDDDGNNLILCMGKSRTARGYERIKEKRIVSDGERELIEVSFIADENVRCVNGLLDTDYFEDYFD